MNCKYRIITLALLSPAIIATSASAQTSVTLEPSKDNAVFDTFSDIESSGASPAIVIGRVGPMSSSAARRMVLEFDLSSLPENITITDATLKFTVIGTNKGGITDPTLSVFKMTTEWGEGTSNTGPSWGHDSGIGQGAPAQQDDTTWRHAFWPNTTWTAPGGDFEATASAVHQMGDLDPSLESLQTVTSAGIIADVQAWADDDASNHGSILTMEDDGDKKTPHIGTRENPDPNLRPTLELTYVPVIPEPSLASALAGMLALMAAFRQRT